MTTPFTHLTDEELARHGAWMRRVALRLVADEATADDLAQEAWTVLARQERGPIGDLRAYLAGIVRNLARRRDTSEHRRRTREAGVARAEIGPDATDLHATLDAQRALLDELEALPEPARGTLFLRYYEGLSAAEIARRKGIPSATVRAQVARGLARLRQRLDRRYGGARNTWALGLLRLPREAERLSWTTTLGGGAMMSTAWKLTLAGGAAVALALAVPRIFGSTESTKSGGPLASDPDRDLMQANARSGEQAPVAVDPHRESVALDPGPTGVSPDVDAILQVVDRMTGEGVPNYAVALADGLGREASITTDRTGIAKLEANWFERTFEIVAVDHPLLRLSNAAVRVVHPTDEPAQDERLVLEVDEGPSYELVLPDDAPDGLRAELDHRQFSDQMYLSVSAPLRHVDGRPWVRLDPARVKPADLGSGPWYLRVSDPFGTWQAFGEVQSIRGRHPGPVHLTTGGAMGVLELRLSLDGERPAGDPCFRLRRHADPEGIDGQRVKYLSAAFGGADGTFTAPYLRPGSYTALISGDGFERYEREYEIRAGETTQEVAQLVPVAGARDVTVIVRSQSGSTRATRLVWVSARRSDGTGEPLSARTLNNAPEGERRHVLSGLTPGRYVVSLSNTRTLPEFEPGQSVEIDDSTSEVVFTCRDVDGSPLGRGSLRLIDAAGGKPVAGGAVSFYVDGRRWVGQSFSDGTCQLPPIIEGLPFEFVVAANGYRPLHVEETSLPFAGALADGTLELRLEPGFGRHFEATRFDAGALTPVPGVEVRFDGELVGRTNIHGRLLVACDEAPARIAIEHANYELEGGGVDAASGRLVNPDLTWTVSLRMRDK